MCTDVKRQSSSIRTNLNDLKTAFRGVITSVEMRGGAKEAFDSNAENVYIPIINGFEELYHELDDTVTKAVDHVQDYMSEHASNGIVKATGVEHYKEVIEDNHAEVEELNAKYKAAYDAISDLMVTMSMPSQALYEQAYYSLKGELGDVLSDLDTLKIDITSLDSLIGTIRTEVNRVNNVVGTRSNANWSISSSGFKDYIEGLRGARQEAAGFEGCFSIFDERGGWVYCEILLGLYSDWNWERAIDHEYFIDIQRHIYDILKAYPNHDQDVLQALLDRLARMTHEDNMSLVYNRDGLFGGNQFSPRALFDNCEDFQEFVRDLLSDLFPEEDWDCDDEIRLFLHNPDHREKDDKDGPGLNNIGCGYVALTNTIFVAFANRPDEFLETFGFPMYTVDPNGNFRLNFEWLLVDIYIHAGYIGQTASPGRRQSILEDYLGSRPGVNVTITNDGNPLLESRPFGVDSQNVREALDNGYQVIVRQIPLILFDMDGKMTHNNPDGTHAMTVTDVTDEGYLIVSSWGSEFQLKPSSYFDVANATLEFEVVRIEFE